MKSDKNILRAVFELAKNTPSGRKIIRLYMTTQI